MSGQSVVQIIAAPVACSGGYQDAWRDVAGWAADQIERLYGNAVRVEYFDLFAVDCPPIPANAQLPVILVNGELLSQGEKLSISAIRRRLEALGVTTASSAST